MIQLSLLKAQAKFDRANFARAKIAKAKAAEAKFAKANLLELNLLKPKSKKANLSNRLLKVLLESFSMTSNAGWIER